MRIRMVVILITTFLIIALDCSGGNSSEPKLVTEMQNFAFVNTQVYTQNGGYVDDITTLNQWLRANRNKKVVSFSGVLAYREGVSGYIIYFVSGDNSQQKFARINLSDQMSREPEIAVHGICSLQEWKNTHPNVRIISISNVPSYSGGVREFTICYE